MITPRTKKFQFKSIRSRLTFWFAIIAVLPLIVVGVIIYNNMVDSRKTSIFHKLEAIRDLKVGEVNNWLDQRIGDVRILASDQEIRMLECIHEAKKEHTHEDIKIITTARDILKRYLKNYDAFYEIFIISPETKRILISTDERDEGKDRSKDPYFTEPLRTRELFIKDIYFSKTEEKPSMAFSIPVFDLHDSSHVTVILVARIDLDKSLYKLLLNRTGMGKTGETLIVNKDAVALNELRWHQNAPLNLKIKAKPAVDASRGKTGIVETVDYRGEMVLAAYTHIPLTRWGFVAKQDIKDIYAPIYEFRDLILFIGAITLAGVLIVAFRISRSISKPLEALYKGSEIIGGGNLDYKVIYSINPSVPSIACPCTSSHMLFFISFPNPSSTNCSYALRPLRSSPPDSISSIIE
jgi:hypothetical protein